MKALPVLKERFGQFIDVAKSEGYHRAIIKSARYILIHSKYYGSLFVAYLRNIHLLHLESFIDSLRMVRLIYKVRNYTGLSVPRLLALYKLSKEIDRLSVLGNIVECGVRNGGSSAVMAFVSNKSSLSRDIWLFDSFEGLPEPTIEDGNKAQVEYHKGKCFGSVAGVREIFHQLCIPENRVHIVKGWFEETFPSVTVQDVALLHIDADWYESVKLCLEKFYDSVRPGGFIVLDDYGHWEGCRRATDEFLKKHSLNIKLVQVDNTGHYFQKP